jgi:RNA polymerase subunit RPABC4/transcription elongation factor Spt4/tellurite resistance protein
MENEKSNVPELSEKAIENEVANELSEAKKLAAKLNIEDVKSGKWFYELFLKVIQSYNRNVRAEYFQQKYPGLPHDEIADILTSVTVKYAVVTGAVTGAAATTNQIAALGSAGMTLALMASVIGAEMLLLSRMQMLLVLDLSVVYDLQLDPDDPEDILMIFGYALGVAPSDLLGKGAALAAGAGAKYAIRKYISKGTLKAIQDFARKIGIKILQRTIIKYTVPVVAAVAGGSYNYVTTKSIGKIAKTHIKNRGKVTDELRLLVSRQNTYDIAFPAAAMYMAQVDGSYTAKEKELYRSILSRMSFEQHTRIEFQKLIDSEDNLLEALAQIDDKEVRANLIDILILMAVYDGDLDPKERDFLLRTAQKLDVPLDIEQVEKKAQEYQIVVEKSIYSKSMESMKEITGKTALAAEQATASLKTTLKTTTVKAAGTIDKVRADQKKKKLQKLEMTCRNCNSTVRGDFKFCPKCGQSMATEKACSACGELIPIDFTFCSNCGAKQEDEI